MKLFTILWLMGITGVISLWGIHLPIPKDEQLPIPVWSIKLLSLIQPTLLLSIAVLIGVTLAPKVGLSAPVAEAISRGTSISQAIQPQVLPGIIGGLLGSGVLIAINFFVKPLLPSDFVMKAEAFSNNTSFLTRILYGGITEELLLRWGMMTLFVWIGWRIFTNGQGEPSIFYFVGAITLSAFLFGLGHLPLVFALKTQVNTFVVAYVIGGNSFFGLIAGYLYWYQGLESAMIAHIVFHIIVVTANYFVR